MCVNVLKNVILCDGKRIDKRSKRMKRLKQYSFWEYMRVLLVFIAGLAVSLLVFSYNVQVRTEQNVEELLDYNTDHQQSQLKFMLNT